MGHRSTGDSGRVHLGVSNGENPVLSQECPVLCHSGSDTSSGIRYKSKFRKQADWE